MSMLSMILICTGALCNSSAMTDFKTITRQAFGRYEIELGHVPAGCVASPKDSGHIILTKQKGKTISIELCSKWEGKPPLVKCTVWSDTTFSLQCMRAKS